MKAISLFPVRLAIVIPAFNEAPHIERVVTALASLRCDIVVVDDASSDNTAAILRVIAKDHPNVVVVQHVQNLGVGGAMVTGFQKALDLGAEIIVKMDGDGQMSADDLPQLVKPLLAGAADFTKGNRFRDSRALRNMPTIRRLGNMGLSFLTKAAVGYWDIFDPCNGFVAVRASVLRRIDLQRLAQDYFFETSLLAEMYLTGAVVLDVDMPARYGDETSHLSIRRVLLQFPRRLVACLLRRVMRRHFLYDFNLCSLYLTCGVPMMLTGAVYGSLKWLQYFRMGEGAPTGTVVISAMLVTLGFQLLLAAVAEDVRSVPQRPICGPVETALKD